MRKTTKLVLFVIAVAAIAIAALDVAVLHPLPIPSPQRALSHVTEVTVSVGNSHDWRSGVKRLSFVLRGDEAKKFVFALRVKRGTGGRCLCLGDYTFEFFEGRRLAATMTLHHWETLRWQDGPWRCDMPLDRDSRVYLMNLIHQHGLPIAK